MSLRKAKEYYNNGKAEQAFTQLEQLARSGNTKAMLELSKWYKEGTYVNISIKKAESWCKKALTVGDEGAVRELEFIKQVKEIYRMLEEGDPLGEYLLAKAYEEGEILTKDLAKAVLYYKKAMDADNILAISRLEELKEEGEENAQLLFLELGMKEGSEYYDPTGVYQLCFEILSRNPDHIQALQLLQHESEVSSKEARYYLGLYWFYQEDKLEEKQGLEILTDEADQGREDALQRFVNACERGKIKDDKRMAAYYRRLHELGNLEGTYGLAQCYFKGAGVEPERDTAEALLQFAAEGGHETAAAEIAMQTTQWEVEGKRYFHGKTVPRDYKQAVHFYQLAHDKEALSPEGIRNLAFCIQNGLGADKDLSYAMNLYEQAAEKGDYKAQYFVGNCYRYGFNGYKKSDKQGVLYYQKSAKGGNADALCALGFCLLHGVGTDKDEWAAWECYEKAVEYGSQEAKEALKNRPSMEETCRNGISVL